MGVTDNSDGYFTPDPPFGIVHQELGQTTIRLHNLPAERTRRILDLARAEVLAEVESRRVDPSTDSGA